MKEKKYNSITNNNKSNNKSKIISNNKSNNKSNIKSNNKNNSIINSNTKSSNNINISEKETKRKKETILNLFYMTPNEIKASLIYELIREQDKIITELWDAMNILQIELPNTNITDFELIEPFFKEPSDQSFIKNRNIKTVFAVTTGSEDFEILKPIFKMILDKYDGFFCTDSEDFKPIYICENL